MTTRETQIDIARRLIATGISKDLVEVLEKQFPELTESEDERIRNDIMEAVENWVPYERVEEIRAYLEKQNEQKPAEWSEGNFPKDIEKDATQFCFDKGINITPHQAKEIATHYLMVGHNEGYVEGRKNAHIPAKELGLPSSMDFKQEWSEEDEAMRDNILRVLNCFVGTVECESNPSLSASYPTYRIEIDWLKSLRLSWEPSKEQEPEYYQHFDPSC